MITVPSTPLHASLVALSTAEPEAGSAVRTLKIDPGLSSVQYELECSLGTCMLGPGARGSLEGDLELELRPGPFPSCSAAELGSRCACRPDLVGLVASSARGLPALLEIRLEGLVLSMRAPAFEVEANGSFETQVGCEILDGTLSLRLLGGERVALPLGGTQALGGRARGLAWIDAAGIHLLRENDQTFRLDAPASGLDLCLHVRGLLRGDLPLPARRPLALPGSRFQLGYTERDARRDFVR
jgi:hypothetical protein